jgi:hypothetical protein
MKILSILFIFFLASCTSTANKLDATESYLTDCSHARMKELQHNLDAALNDLKAADIVSAQDPTTENKANAAAVSVQVLMDRLELDNARTACSVR